MPSRWNGVTRRVVEGLSEKIPMSVYCVYYILWLFLTLTLLSFILFVVFLLCTFCTDRKYQRARHTGKIFTNVLCSDHICEPSVGRLFVTPGFRLFSGCCGTRSMRIFGIIYIRITLKQPRTMA